MQRFWFAEIDNRFSSVLIQIVFEGVVGNGIQGDIAIDDVSVKSGACGTLGTRIIV